jgi:hypothetical protein
MLLRQEAAPGCHARGLQCAPSMIMPNFRSYGPVSHEMSIVETAFQGTPHNLDETIWRDANPGAHAVSVRERPNQRRDDDDDDGRPSTNTMTAPRPGAGNNNRSPCIKPGGPARKKDESLTQGSI